MAQYKENEFDVIVIGGGITGAGTARDCSLRGLRTLLIERNDIADGATGRNHGLLHSGARYAVTDQESATECIQENMILKRVANHCVDDTSGFFITLPEDDLAYQAKFVEACTKAGIKAEVIDGIRYITAAPSAIVCSVRIDIHLIDDVVDSVVYTRGCNGNAKGIGALIKGMKVDEAIRRLKGIDCAGRGTSCPDQLARVLEAAMSREPVTR